MLGVQVSITCALPATAIRPVGAGGTGRLAAGAVKAGGANSGGGSAAPQPARDTASNKLSNGRIRRITGRANNIFAVKRHPIFVFPAT